MKRFINQLIPFILLGIALAAFAFGIILLAYLFLFGALVGLVLFAVNWIRSKLFPPKTLPKVNKPPQSGRIIDSDDWKNL